MSLRFYVCHHTDALFCFEFLTLTPHSDPNPLALTRALPPRPDWHTANYATPARPSSLSRTKVLSRACNATLNLMQP